MAKRAGKKEDDSKLYAFLSILLTVIGFIIAYAVKKNDKYVMFYAKQGLVLFIGSVIIWVVSMIPIIMFIAWIAWIGWLVLWIIGIVYSLSGEMKDIPIVGVYADKFNF
ncbi:hypothetical protein J4217_02925 [Candidatus Pacearchaeota archaeon]|nr:hypothetical protein [Candidatus Pacearchaeota archaeon]